MSDKLPAITFTQAIDEYYGGIKAINKQSLPFKCKCGGTTYKNSDDIEKPVMTLTEAFKHVRKNHKERISKNGDQG